MFVSVLSIPSAFVLRSIKKKTCFKVFLTLTHSACLLRVTYEATRCLRSYALPTELRVTYGTTRYLRSYVTQSYQRRVNKHCADQTRMVGDAKFDVNFKDSFAVCGGKFNYLCKPECPITQRVYLTQSYQRRVNKHGADQTKV